MAFKYLSYWTFPILSGLVWIGTLLGLLLHWIIDTDRRHYPSMSEGTKVAYISDVGAFKLKPLFITGCVLTTVFLDVSFLADRWLRHRGRLVPNSTTGEKILSWLNIVFAVFGTAGLILLSVFDTYNHETLHRGFLLLFMGGYVLSAVFQCWEYQRLGIKNRQHRVLRIGFWIKLAFILIEVALSAVFIGTMFTDNWDVGAIFEWIIALVFSLYVFSFVIDLYPAVHTKQGARFSRSDRNGDIESQLSMGETSGEQATINHRFPGPLVPPPQHQNHYQSPRDSDRTLAEHDVGNFDSSTDSPAMHHNSPSSHKLGNVGPPPNDF